MATSETNTAKKFLADHAHGPLRLYRNNNGSAWAGKKVGTVHPGKPDQAVIVRPGSHIEFGLKTGSGDWIGWESIEVTADMVGQRVARFLTVEVKTISYPKQTNEQTNWSAQVVAAGGRSLLVREVRGELGYTVDELWADGSVSRWEPQGMDLVGLEGRRS